MTAPGPTPAVVLGLGVNGLGTVRALGRAGIPAVAITTGRDGPALRTRFARVVRCPEMSTNPRALVDTLLGLAREFAGPSIVFPSGDLSLHAASAHRELLAPHYRLPFPSHAVVELVLDKHRFYRWAGEQGQPIARTWYPAEPAALEEAIPSMRFPVVIKPSVATAAWRARGLKILAAADAGALRTRFAEALALHPDLIVQEVVPGPDSALHFSLTYRAAGGRELAMFTGRKLRQWVPRFGISSLAESRRDERIAALTRSVLDALGYDGYGSVEFKWDPRDEQFRMTEVTARTWYPHALAERCGVNLPALAYRDLVAGGAGPIAVDYPDGVKWMDEVGDLRSAWHYWRRGELSAGAWLASLRGPLHLALMTRDDPGPGLALLGGAAVAPVRAVGRRLRRVLGGAR